MDKFTSSTEFHKATCRKVLDASEKAFASAIKKELDENLNKGVDSLDSRLRANPVAVAFVSEMEMNLTKYIFRMKRDFDQTPLRLRAIFKTQSDGTMTMRRPSPFEPNQN